MALMNKTVRKVPKFKPMFDDHRFAKMSKAEKQAYWSKIREREAKVAAYREDLKDEETKVIPEVELPKEPEKESASALAGKPKKGRSKKD